MSTKKVITFDGEPQDIFVHLEVGDFFVKPPYINNDANIFSKIWVMGEYFAHHLYSGDCITINDDEEVKKIQKAEIIYSF